MAAVALLAKPMILSIYPRNDICRVTYSCGIYVLCCFAKEVRRRKETRYNCRRAEDVCAPGITVWAVYHTVVCGENLEHISRGGRKCLRFLYTGCCCRFSRKPRNTNFDIQLDLKPPTHIHITVNVLATRQNSESSSYFIQ